MRVEVKGVKRVTARLADGTKRTYYYHRKSGRPLPGDPKSPEFWQALKDFDSPLARSPEESVRGVIESYKRSPKYRNKAVNTKADYDRQLARICDHMGDIAVWHIDAGHVDDLQQLYADTPAAANRLIQVLSIILKHARRLFPTKVPHNAAARFDRFASGEGWQPWPETVVRSALEKADEAIGTAIRLGLYTGQRRGDVLLMMESHYDGERIKVRQQKTGEWVWILAHPELREHLDAMLAARRSSNVRVIGDRPLVLSRTGKPLHESTLSHAIRELLDGVGGHGLVFHGLRHTAATMLAEAGCSDHEIMAITGHRTLAMVQKYTKLARRRVLADSAISRISGKPIGK